MERRQLEYFLAVIDEGSVTSAATALHVSQPTISVALRALEKELGGQLFERTSTGLSLAAAGRALADPARQVQRDFSVARESVRDVLCLEGGTLDIGAIPALASGWLPDRLLEFRSRYPDVSVRVYSEVEDHAVAVRVRNGEYNLGLSASTSGIPGMQATCVGEQRLQALLPPGSPDTGRHIAVEELAGMDLIALHRNRSSSRRWFEEQLAPSGLTPRVRIELPETDAIVPLVARGAGYALWWTPMLSASLGGCVLRPIRPEFTRPIFISRRDGAISPAARAFLQLLGTEPTIGEYHLQD